MTGFFGTLEGGETVNLYTIKGKNTTAEIMNLGASLVRLTVFGRDVIGGFDTPADYVADDSYQGATVGRVANRIENAEFVMDGKTYSLTENDNGSCLHGGSGFSYKIWDVIDHTEGSITLSYVSPDGEDGFPAELKVTVTFTLIDDSLMIDYRAIPNGKTPISLTNHSYFNLDGLGGDIKNHNLKIYADTYTAVDGRLIPTGEHPNVSGSYFDFTGMRKIADESLGAFVGYDHNFILSPTEHATFLGKRLALAAEVSCEDIKMQVYTDRPCVQFYTGNFLGNGIAFKGGVPAIKHGAFCLETQTEPGSVKRGEGLYDKGELYTHTTVYKFDRH